GPGSGVGPGAGGGSTSSGTGGSTGTGSGGSSPGCKALAPMPRRVWRLSVEQYQAAVKDVLGLATAPQLTNRGGEAQWAFFGDASLGVDDAFEYALFQAVDGVLPNI